MDLIGLRKALEDYYAAHYTDDNGYSLAEWAEKALADTTLGNWKVFEKGFPNYFETYYCDGETAEYIAELETKADLEWGCRTYIFEPLESD